MASVGELLQTATRALPGDEARSDAEILLGHALGVSRAWLFAHARDGVAEAQQQAYAALIERRAQGEPVAYLTGRRGFWTLDLEVTPATLIPRPETETLVEQALARLPADRVCTVADLGTGSGAIALAIASERPRAQVAATDASSEALAVARGNAVRLGLRNVAFLQGDWMAPLTGRRFDMIVSNPPYIEAGDAHLAQGDLRFEPPAALASGADGLDAIRAIVHAARHHLEPGGWLLLEHGWNQGEAVRALLRESGYAGIFTATDLEGRDRVTAGNRSSPTTPM
ncbi:MAG TPA: peptide chain release factor N(5)-glutamine methyltransferase [Rhodanobacteraceae bacterium]|nr:peptide chain release factor N(5)-glutamine methyltransferase [Rhodanobacteraceae bacterium]